MLPDDAQTPEDFPPTHTPQVPASPDASCDRTPTPLPAVAPQTPADIVLAMNSPPNGDTGGTLVRDPASAPLVAPPPVPSLVPGYEILGVLGRGGMGVVYKARHLKLNRIVALKTILSGAHADSDEMARFQTEAEAIARLQHPGIVAVHEVGEHDGVPYLSLDFCPGGSLEKKLAGTPLEANAAAALVRRLAEAVQAAHEAKVVHRDLKPANVLLMSDGSPRITDFGLAKKLDEQGRTQTGSVMGTPSYMAPEQARGSKQVGPAADVYALGVILYECLTGRPPFKAATAHETVLQVLNDEPVPPRQLQSKTPRDLETICLKCLHKEPGRRYGSARALADDLGRFERGEPITARPVGPVERGWRWCRRDPALAGALAGVLLTFLAGAVLSTTFAIRASNHAEQVRVEAEARGRAEQEKASLALLRAEQEKANEQLADAVAHGLLKVVVSREESSNSETEALWELATADGDLRVRTMEVALRKLSVTQELRRRSDNVLQSVVGLDVKRRNRVECILSDVLDAEGVTHEQRRDVVTLLARLGVRDPAVAQKVASVILTELSRTSDVDGPGDLTDQLEVITSCLDAAKRAVIYRKASDTLLTALRKAKQARVSGSLAKCLAQVSVRLAPVEADDLCTKGVDALLATLPKATDAGALRDLVEGLETISARLGRKESAKVAEATLAALEATLATNEFEDVSDDDPFPPEGYTRKGLLALTRALLAVCVRSTPGKAQAVCIKAADTLLARLGKVNNANESRALAECLVMLSARLGPPNSCAKAVEGLFARLGKAKDNDELLALSRGLAVVSVGLGPAQAAKTVDLLLAARAKATHVYAGEAIDECLAAVSGQLGPAEAFKVADALLARLGSSAKGALSSNLVRCLAEVSRRLESDEAARVAEVLLAAMTRTTKAGALCELAWCLKAVSSRLRAATATAACAKAADALLAHLDNESDTDQLGSLAWCLDALSAHLGPADAAAACAKAADALTTSLSKLSRRKTREYSLLCCLATLSHRLGPTDATRVRVKAAGELATWMKEGRWPDDIGRSLDWIMHLFGDFATHLDAKSAAQLASTLLTICEKQEARPSNLRYPLSALVAFSARLEKRQVRALANLILDAGWLEDLTAVLSREGLYPGPVLVASAVGGSTAGPCPVAALAVFGRVSNPPAPLPAQDLVDLLKHPRCVGAARRAILDQLSRQYQRPFADQWDFVSFATEQELGLEFQRPPQRPNRSPDERR